MTATEFGIRNSEFGIVERADRTGTVEFLDEIG